VARWTGMLVVTEKTRIDYVLVDYTWQLMSMLAINRPGLALEGDFWRFVEVAEVNLRTSCLVTYTDRLREGEEGQIYRILFLGTSMSCDAPAIYRRMRT